MWNAIYQLNKLKYRAASSSDGKRKAEEGQFKESKKKKQLYLDHMIKDFTDKEIEYINEDLDKISKVEDLEQIFNIFDTLYSLQRRIDSLNSSKYKETQKRISDLRILNIKSMMSSGMELLRSYSSKDCVQYLMKVKDIMDGELKKDNDVYKCYEERKNDFDKILKTAKEINEIENEYTEEESTNEGSSSKITKKYETTPNSGHYRPFPLRWSNLSRRGTPRLVTPKNKWSPIDPNYSPNLFVKTPKDAFDLKYFSVVLYELDKNEQMSRIDHWNEIRQSVHQSREDYDHNKYPHQILQEITSLLWVWDDFSSHQIQTINYFCYMYTKHHGDDPNQFLNNITEIVKKFDPPENIDKQIDQAGRFCVWCETGSVDETKENELIKIILQNEEELFTAKFRAFLPMSSPLKWLLINGNIESQKIEEFSIIANDDYKRVYKIFHNTDFGEIIHDQDVSLFLELYDFLYGETPLQLSSPLVVSLAQLRIIFTKRNIKVEEDQQHVRTTLEELSAYMQTEDWNEQDDKQFYVFQKLSKCFV